MAKSDDVRSFETLKAYPSGKSQGGRAIQSVKGSLSENDGTGGHRTVIRETPEGRAIARTRENSPMVSVEKIGCEIGVDHGVLDPITIAPLDPDAYADGRLYFTGYVKTHITAYEGGTDPDRPIVDEIEPPDVVRGEAPADGAVAKSLWAGKNGEKRGELFAKKRMMAACPASIFTGRTRLWVQAMYGRHDDLTLCRLDVSLPSATPAITLTLNEIPFRIHTSCGVYFDTATGEHWLIDVGFGKVSFYPMSADDCIEELRDYLLDPAFPAADKERVETYILSDSLPIREKIQEVVIPETANYSMGYGWHFNWDGDRCDIVIVDQVANTGGGNKNRSMHYRLNFSKDTKGIWSVDHSVVEGPTYWKSLRHIHPIVEPLWDEMSLLKIGAHLGPEPFGDAPYYAFYARDVLKVCRYSATTTEVPPSVERSPGYFNIATYMRIGADAASWIATGTYYAMTVRLACGIDSVSFVDSAYSSSVWRSSGGSSAGTFNGYGPGSVISNGDAASANSGYPGTIPTSTVGTIYGDLDVLSGTPSNWPQVSITVPSGKRGEDGYITSTVTEESGSRSTRHYVTTISVIPFYDSEACYLYAEQVTETSETVTTGTATGSFFFGYRVFETGELLTTWAKESTTVGNGDGHLETRNSAPTSVSSGKLVCRSGTFNVATFPGKAGFFASADTVSQFYDTRSSASGKAVYSAATDVSDGMSALNTASNFVGWA